MPFIRAPAKADSMIDVVIQIERMIVSFFMCCYLWLSYLFYPYDFIVHVGLNHRKNKNRFPVDYDEGTRYRDECGEWVMSG